jgi:hypothetical protein
MARDVHALHCANFEVANNRDTSGRVTAERINRDSRDRTASIFKRVTGLIIPGSLIAASFLVTLAPMPARAEENKEGAHQEIEALEAKVESLQRNVSALQGQISALQSQLEMVQSNAALALGPFLVVDPNSELGVAGPQITFKGANIHIVSGSGSTNDNDNPTGLGNLIIGYDEPPGGLTSTDRAGSHNLVIGRYNRFTQAACGGLVAGELNTINSKEASVTGGANNTASGLFATVSGGVSNIASGGQASVGGGVNNVASGSGASVSGGESNTASGSGASICGGMSNAASGPQATVSGGDGNTASGPQANVSGGVGNTASGSAAVVIGGQNVTDTDGGSIRPQPPFNP